MERSTPMISVQALTKEFKQGRDKILAVNGIDLEIYRGEIFGLVGESGCGKSTLGHMLVHLINPSFGKIMLNGEDITSPTAGRKKSLCRQIQLVFQDPYASIDTGKTVGWLLDELLRIHRLGNKHRRRQEVLKMLSAVGLDESFYTRFPNELSGGQRQRVAIALALILQPDFVVCDEPVSALDVSVQAQVLNLLQQLRQSMGLTYLFISHDLNVVSYISDRIGVMYLGRIVELGSADEITEKPLHPYTKALFSSSVNLADTGERIVLSGELPSPSQPPSGCPFHTRCPQCIDRCRTEPPQLKKTGGRMCACHLVE